jgi:two-component system C4-dicarboxylate transport response regulator DctD
MMTQASVLIVDDEPSVRETLSEWLKRKNFRVLETENGRQALEKIRLEDLDMVIADVVMPVMNGIDLLKQAKVVNADIPFLMISGYPAYGTAVNTMQLGASDYLQKPFTPEEFSRRVSHALRLKALSKPFAAAKGILFGAALATVLWVLIIWALAALLS